MLRVLTLLFGVVLLLPGVCSLGFMAAFIPELGKSGSAGDLGPLAILWLFCFAVSLVGVLMIRNAALAGAKPRDPPAGG